ncbi:ARMET-like protein [Salpingoeca rosetta]|uniref:Mesencephalic astrocyte-derived neurotrophic factor homolog n=1 Tax=Salpingoeca rosetta (strain ATCC 50818 / BSB-021) TaxID=946362 RepID=F2UF83_SALR5|nr:ARMET-like protein [Salpingoeca rosetta]EGD75283.1 ARMET-like protein [Salpingoeca rosetta]|eukprot:XP_004992336.1 ARMET-like protein [Salpingoeca rosetta]
MNMRSVLGVAVLALVTIALVSPLAVEAKKKQKDEKECEVCKKVVGKVLDMAKKEGVDVTDQDGIASLIKKHCKSTRINKENRLCYYIGGSEDAATGLLREVTGPISRYMPPAAVCSRLKKKDQQICDLQYDEEIDLSKIDLKKQRVKVLKKILNEQFGDSCKGCLEKTDYIKRIEELKAKHQEL